MFESITESIAHDMGALIKVKSEDASGERLARIVDALDNTRQQVQVQWMAATDAADRTRLSTLHEGFNAAHALVSHIAAAA
ncbi:MULTISPECIES: HrpD6 family protein [Xanthomonas]|uniref:Serine kinase n=1 Tax=Xanthomonas hortorum pv. pelargonii TaxID=453602 RepID=A0A6V7BT72_9XANT|nr:MULTISPECIES: HrpD6 family protein [Xanthomonas]MCE4353831.1 serine kinase [Xanthomonas hortorum pv. pelargonii]MCM5522731.1 serine kinase [Xanthomonas hortorum pv. pelargonii]MCM5535306.1 serine kinase [Xanthomonas hortorum pv. pelargonii]MCM5538835.1 serine kinase [Xanthomonas hortorum pv. pelargonii]MCM5543189.1 serine kinase [Xanthomonas hortorum pv. pelargonii]